MAKCDEGYLCEVCGRDVGGMVDSDLYLRFVIGRVDPEVLHTAPERHLRCNPAVAQYILHDRFPPVACEGLFDKRKLDADFVERETQLLTRGWLRLRELAGSDLPISEYPLPEVVESMRQEFG